VVRVLVVPGLCGWSTGCTYVCDDGILVCPGLFGANTSCKENPVVRVLVDPGLCGWRTV